MRHGGDLTGATERYGIAPGDWLDLSTGINPHAYSCPADEAGRDASDARLPSRDRLEHLLEAARTCYRVPGDIDICAAPGTELLIRMQAWLVQGKTALAPTSYRSYSEAWSAAARELIHMPAGDIGKLSAMCSIAIVNPNNPDGRRTEPERLLDWARTRSETARLIVDEAFGDAEPEGSIVPCLSPDDPVIVFRSFGKFFGLPGLRLGFAIGAPNLVEPVRAMLGDWPVSATALDTGTAALTDIGWQTEMRLRLAREAKDLDRLLCSAGLESAGGTNLFRLVRHPRATAIHEHLAVSGIWVRRFDDDPETLRFGLPGSFAGMKRLEDGLSGLAG